MSKSPEEKKEPNVEKPGKSSGRSSGSVHSGSSHKEEPKDDSHSSDDVPCRSWWAGKSQKDVGTSTPAPPKVDSLAVLSRSSASPTGHSVDLLTSTSQTDTLHSYPSRTWRYFGRTPSKPKIDKPETQYNSNPSSEKAEAPRIFSVDQSMQTSPPDQEHNRSSSFGLFLWGEGSNTGFWSPENAALLIGVIVAAVVTLTLAILVILKFKKANLTGQSEISFKVKVSSFKLEALNIIL